MSTGPSVKTREMVVRRSAGRCVRCGGMAVQVHHRKPRGAGGTSDPRTNSPENLIAVCLDCHQWIESNRREAYDQGWLVRRGFDPVEVPLHLPDGSLVMLMRDGSAVISPPMILPDLVPPF